MMLVDQSFLTGVDETYLLQFYETLEELSRRLSFNRKASYYMMKQVEILKKYKQSQAGDLIFELLELYQLSPSTEQTPFSMRWDVLCTDLYKILFELPPTQYLFLAQVLSKAFVFCNTLLQKNVAESWYQASLAAASHVPFSVVIERWSPFELSQYIFVEKKYDFGIKKNPRIHVEQQEKKLFLFDPTKQQKSQQIVAGSLCELK